MMAVALGASTLTVKADDGAASRQKIAMEIADAVTVSKLDDSLVRQMFSAKIELTIKKLQLDEKSAAQAREIMNQALQQVSPDKIKAIYRDAYAENFSEEELSGILAFYKSDSGKALLAKGKTLEKHIAEKQAEIVKSMLLQTEREFRTKLPGVLKDKPE